MDHRRRAEQLLEDLEKHFDLSGRGPYAMKLEDKMALAQIHASLAVEEAVRGLQELIKSERRRSEGSFYSRVASGDGPPSILQRRTIPIP